MSSHLGPLFDQPAPVRRKRHRTATTSVDAYHDARPRLQPTRRRVLEAVRARGPLTRHEIAAATGLPLSSVCGRANELMAAGELREQVVGGRKTLRNGRHVLEAVITRTLRAG